MRLKNHWLNWITALGVFALALIPRIISLGTFLAPDEGYHWKLSNEFLTALLRHDWADTVPQGLPGLTLAWIESIGMLFRYAIAWLASGGRANLEQIMAPDQPFSQLAQRQMVVVLANTLIVVAIYLLAQRVFGTRGALMGTMFIAFDPFFLAESRVLRFEALVAGFMTLSVLAALVYVKERRGYALGLSAVLAGLAALTKVSAILLMPVIGLIFLTLLPDWSLDSVPRALRRVGVALIVWTLLTALTFWVVWPAMWVSPANTLRTVSNFAYEASEEGLEGRGVFFWGHIYPSDPGPWFYPVNFLFRITPVVLLGIIVAIVLIIRNRRYAKRHLSARYWIWWGLLALFVYTFFFALAMTFGAKKYDRYLMPVFPAFGIVAGVALTQISNPKSQNSKFGMRGLKSDRWSFDRWYLVFVVLLVVQAATALPYLPYYYTYYNPLLSAIKPAQDAVRVGYGEGVDRIATYLNAKPNADRIKLASAMSSRFDPLFAGETIPIGNLDGRWVQADYVFIYIAQAQRGKHDPEILAYLARQEPEFVLRLHGIEYGKLYPGPAAQYYSGTKLEGRGTLYGYDLSATQLRAGDVLTATLYWRNEGQGAADSFFVSVADAADYPWTTALAQPRSGFEEAAHNRKEIVESEAVLDIPIGMPPGHYFLKMGFVTDDGRTLVGRFKLPSEGDDVLVALPGSFSGVDDISVPHALDFATEDVSLLGYDLSPAIIQAGDRGWLTLFWRAKQDAPRDYVVGIRMLADSGQEVTYWLGRPVYSGYATSGWTRGQVVQDPWELSLPAEVPSGNYRLELVLFDSTTGEPLARTPLATWSVAAP